MLLVAEEDSGDPFALVLGTRPLWAVVLLILGVNLTYVFYVSMRLYWWTPLVEYIPFYTLLIWQYIHWRRGSDAFRIIRLPRKGRRGSAGDEPDMSLQTAIKESPDLVAPEPGAHGS